MNKVNDDMRGRSFWKCVTMKPNAGGCRQFCPYAMIIQSNGIVSRCGNLCFMTKTGTITRLRVSFTSGIKLEFPCCRNDEDIPIIYCAGSR